MEREYINQIYQVLQRQIGLHRQLKELIRLEKEALVSAQVASLQDVVFRKEATIESIRREEDERVRLTGALAALLRRSGAELTITQLAIHVQGFDLKLADQIRSAYNALTILIQRIQDQSNHNRVLIEKGMEHIRQMKVNVLGNEAPGNQTYNPRGERASGNQARSRLFNREI